MFGWLKNKHPSRGAENEASHRTAASPDHAVTSVEQLLQKGNACLDQGQLGAAEQCYRDAIAIAPSNASAQVNLAYVLLEQQRIEDAAGCLDRVLATDPSNPDAHYLLGSLALRQSDPECAAGHFEAALSVKPDFEFALRDLCQTLIRTGQNERACTAVEKAIAASRNPADQYCNLGNIKMHAGEYHAALECFARTISTIPEHAAALMGTGLAYRYLGRFDEAAEAFLKALAVDPENPDAHYNLGIIRQAQGRLDDAIECYRRAIAARLDMAEAWYGLGSALLAQERHADAAESYRQAIKFKPDFTEAHCYLGYTLSMMKQMGQAVACYRKVLELEPGHVFANNKLSLALAEEGDADSALEGLRRAVLLKPDEASLRLHLGCALRDVGKLDAAIEQFRRVESLEPDNDMARGNALFIMSYDAAFSPGAYVVEARRFGRLLTDKAQQRVETVLARPGLDRVSLRVGLVSGDLRDHPVGFFLENVLHHLDRDMIELVAYPTTSEEGLLTARIRPRFSLWRPLVGLNNEAAAKRIRDDGIDILIDLSGHTAQNRLALFAWKPAPVQATWLGYWASTGVAEIDYILADPVSVPFVIEDQFTETVWRLPDTRLCPSPLHDSPPVAPLPALECGHLTFGTYQHMSKLNDAVFAVWGKIFAALPGARLRFQSKQLQSRTTRETLLASLRRHGIMDDRVDMYGHTDRAEYLESHEDVDIILDTFPFPGGTTTCEALWMGVPTLTLVGNTMLSRQGASLLACAGLSEWIAGDEDEYIRLAIRHASDLASLATLRRSLREQVLVSPLFDGQRFAKNLEQALFGMWRKKVSR